MRLLLFLVLLVGIGCAGDTDTAAIDQARTAYQDSPSRETAAALGTTIDDFIRANPDRVDTNANLLNEKASAHLDQNQFAEAVQTLFRAQRDFPNADDATANAILLVDIYDKKLRNATGAASVRQAFVEAYPNHPKAQEWAPQFENNPPLPEKIRILTQQLYGDTTGRVDYKMANEIVQSAEIYALMLPEAEPAPEMLYQAGQIAGSVRATNKAIELNERVYTRYPDHRRASSALFLTAFTYDNELGDVEKARPLYEAFIAKYPDSDFAESAQFQLRNLGKSAEEVLRELDQQAQ